MGSFPGPGAYHPEEPIEPAKKQLFPRKHYLCISAPAMPLPDSPPAPGPGSYEMADYEGQPKHYMSGQLLSPPPADGPIPTRRIQSYPAQKEQVQSKCPTAWNLIRHQDIRHLIKLQAIGKAHYRPVNMGKQSFIYNAATKWI